MNIRHKHTKEVNMNINDLKKEQIKLAKKVVLKDDYEEITYIGGVDQAFLDNKVISGVVVMEMKTLKIVEKKYAVVEAPMQYIPGFLSYREGPAIVEAITKLDQRPEMLLVDGNGILHPRRIGLASHVGILLDIPTIGVAKKISMGEIKDGKIMDEGRVLGIELKTKEYSKPIYISQGHRVSLKSCEKIVKQVSVEGHKMPEPLHEAHKYVNKVRKKLMSKKDAQKNRKENKEKEHTRRDKEE